MIWLWLLIGLYLIGAIRCALGEWEDCANWLKILSVGIGWPVLCIADSVDVLRDARQYRKPRR